jgi:hypothetical protein
MKYPIRVRDRKRERGLRKSTYQYSGILVDLQQHLTDTHKPIQLLFFFSSLHFKIKRKFAHVRTVPKITSIYASADKSLVGVCRTYAASSEQVLRAVLYSLDGYNQRAQIQRNIQQRMDHTTCMYIILTGGLILCCAPCCFPCFQQINPKLDEMSMCQQVQQQQDQSSSSKDITYTFTANSNTSDMTPTNPSIMMQE